MEIRCADHVTPLYPQKLALTSPTGGGRSVGIVRSRTKATEFFFYSCVEFVQNIIKHVWKDDIGINQIVMYYTELRYCTVVSLCNLGGAGVTVSSSLST